MDKILHELKCAHFYLMIFINVHAHLREFVEEIFVFEKGLIFDQVLDISCQQLSQIVLQVRGQFLH
jgi:hypothetical protein